jgi:serine/threonine protein kinase
MNSGQLLSQRYKLLNILGSGGMSQAFLAEDTQRPSNPHCVVKKLQPLSQDPKLLAIARTLFQREAEVLEELGEHDQIPRLLAHFEENHEFYLVEEFVDGHTLATELQPGMQWSETKVIKFLLEILPVLEFIHSQNVIHRDIKPDNIIRRDRDGRLVLIDFGAVRQVQADLTASNPALAATIVGTFGYMPSEQAYGHPRLNSDLYALGIICIQAITGLMLTQLQIDNQTGELQWTEAISIPISNGLIAILSKMVRNLSKDRYLNATEALEAVNDLKTQLRTSPAKTANKTLAKTLVNPQQPQKNQLPKVHGLRRPLSLLGVGLAAAAGVALVGNQILNAFTQKPQGSFGGDRILDIGVVTYSRPNAPSSNTSSSGTSSADPSSTNPSRPNLKVAYNDLSNYFKTELQERFGKDVSVKLHIVNTSEGQSLEEAKQAIKSQKWELAFTAAPMLSAAAVANNYKFAARMSPTRTQSESVLFVRKDSPIQSLDDLTSDKKIALADFNSAQGFYMPVYDLFGKTLNVDMNNTPRESMEKVRSGQVDVGASVYISSLKKATDLRVLHVSRAIPLAGVYIAPNLTSQDQKLVADLLLAAPPSIQENARYKAGNALDYTEFLKVVRRVEEITSCTNWQVNPVKLYCGNVKPPTGTVSTNSSPAGGIVGTTSGYRAFENRIEFTLQGEDRKTYRLVLPRTVLNSDPNLDAPGALNFRKVTIQTIQPVEVEGVPELRITAPGQLKVLS